MVDILVLGPLRVRDGGRQIPTGGPVQRSVLGLLAAHANQVVATDRLIEGVWGAAAPRDAEHALQSHVSRLRGALRAACGQTDVIRSSDGGYLLDVTPARLDAARFADLGSLAEQEAASGDVAAAVRAADEALGLWRGPAYADVRDSAILRAETDRLEELKLRVTEVRIDCLIAAGRGADLVSELVGLTDQHPFRERLWAQLVHVLYRSGRQMDALAAYRRVAALLRDELGVDPCRDLKQIHERVLRQDPGLECPPAPVIGGRSRSAPPRAAGRRPPLPTALAPADIPLAGRVAELEELQRVWKQAQRVAPQVVLVSGEAGIGKTRLASELASHVHEGGASVLYGACSEGLGLPYEAFIEPLRHAVVHGDRERLGARLGDHPGELTRLLPRLSDIVGDLAEPLRSDPGVERHRLFLALASWLEAAAGEQGLLLVLDDLHWADAATVSLLRHLPGRSLAAPLMILGTYRDTDLDRGHPLTAALAEMRRQATVSRLALTSLQRDDTVELLRSALRGGDLDDRVEELVTSVWEATAGNPLFVVEVLRHLTGSGVVHPDESGRWTTDVAHVSHLRMPDSFREVVRGRLSRLSDRAHEVLTMAAIVGQDFSLDVLVGLLEEPSPGVLEAVEEAVAANAVRETDVGAYAFTHALVRSALYDQLSATRRAHSHLAVGEVLESRGADHADLAFHFGHAAGEHAAAKAFRYAMASGRDALEKVAPEQAIEHFGRALAQVDRLGARGTSRAVEALVGMGTAQRDAGDRAYRDTLVEAAGLARRLGAPRLLAAAALANHRGLWSTLGGVDDERVAVLRSALASLPPDSAALRARLLARLAVELVFAADHREVVGLVAEAEAIAGQAGIAEVVADVLEAKVTAAWHPDTAASLHHVAAELVTVAEQVGDPLRVAHAHMWHGLHLRTVGDTVAARAATERGAAIAEEFGHDPALLFAAAYRTAQAAMEGDVEAAEAAATETLAYGEMTGQPDAASWFAAQLYVIRLLQGRLAEFAEFGEQVVTRDLPGLQAAQAGLAVILLHAGRHDEARVMFERFVDGIDDLRFDWTWPQTLYGLALLCRPLADPPRAAVLYERLRGYAGQAVNGGAIMFGTVDHALGLTAAAAGRLDDSAAHFAAAAAFEERAGMRGWLMFTHLEWARTLVAMGGGGAMSAAGSLLTRARKAAEEIGNVPVIRDSDDLAAVIAGTQP